MTSAKKQAKRKGASRGKAHRIQASAQKALAVHVISLGCPKNRVDTERLLGGLGLSLRPASLGRARLVLINTCGFIEPASRESIRAILDCAKALARLKKRPLLAVAGCLVGRYGAETLAQELPEVDLWLPTAQMPEWPGLLRKALGLECPESGQARDPAQSATHLADQEQEHGVPASGPLPDSAERLDSIPRLRSTPPSYAWLKIAEGCSNACAFCVIPQIRGPLRSTPAPALLAESASLLRDGARELILVAQDSAAWGRDLFFQPGPKARWDLLDLAEAILALPDARNLAWLRLLYLYPGHLSASFFQRMAAIGRPLLPYLDIPLQHSEARILKSMGRPFSRGGDFSPRAIVERARALLPGCALRSSLIVGYPGESEADFQALCRFVAEARFENLGVFAWQAEEGSRAATFPGQIPQAEREARRAELMRLQAQISADFLAGKVGAFEDVLIDEIEPEWSGLFRGRCWFQAPEADGLTYISAAPDAEPLAPGQLRRAEISASQNYDLSALV